MLAASSRCATQEQDETQLPGRASARSGMKIHLILIISSGVLINEFTLFSGCFKMIVSHNHSLGEDFWRVLAVTQKSEMGGAQPI